MLTIRDAGAFCIRLIGLSYAARAVSGYVALLLTPFVLSRGAFTDTDPLLAASISSSIGTVVVAIVALAGAERIAAFLFPATPLPAAYPGRSEWLFIGVALSGVWLAADALPSIIQSLGTIAYYLEASRRSLMQPALERSWPRFIADLITVFTGVMLALSARRVAARLDRRSPPAVEAAPGRE